MSDRAIPGPRVTLEISCEGCEHLVSDRSGMAHGCREPSVVDLNDGETRLVGVGDCRTPVFCPFRVEAIGRAVGDGVTRREAGRLAEALKTVCEAMEGSPSGKGEQGRGGWQWVA